MKRFEMHRQVDETGISGTGHIADGIVFDDGSVVIRWRTENPGTTMFGSLEHAKAVHGHAGKTQFVFRDALLPGEKEVYFCAMCFSVEDLAGHCFNCGAGGTNVSIPAGHVELIRKSASWVGKHYYANDEDKADHAERSALRRAVGNWPGRHVEASPLAHEPENARRVNVVQKTAAGWTSIGTERAHGETDAQILERTAHLLPWMPEVPAPEPTDPSASVFTTTMTNAVQGVA